MSRELSEIKEEAKMTTDERLERLERELNRSRKRFRTEKPRAVLGLAKNMPLLCLYDEKEEPRATIAVLTDGPHLDLRDEKGNKFPIR
jgi:hypothetical protein